MHNAAYVVPLSQDVHIAAYVVPMSQDLHSGVEAVPMPQYVHISANGPGWKQQIVPDKIPGRRWTPAN